MAQLGGSRSEPAPGAHWSASPPAERQNKVQFQHGMSLSEFIECYSTEAPFMAAVEFDDDGHPGHVRFDAIADYTGETVDAWAKSALHPDVHLLTDGLTSFNAAGAEVAAHGAIIVGKHNPSDLAPFRWINTFISNTKTAITGTYHHVDFAKYRYRYLAESRYRVNRRFDLSSLVGRLVHACARTAPCPGHWLRLADIS